VCNEIRICVPPHDNSPFEGCEDDCGSGTTSQYGDILAVYRGVPAYSNGSIYGCHACSEGASLGLTCGTRCAGQSSPETPFGIAYQCVEYIRRFYYTVYGDADVGYSRGNGGDYTGAKATSLGLEEYRNGQTDVIPRPDDIIVFDGGSYGHIGIVTKVDEAAGRVWFIQQNVGDHAVMSVGYRVTAGTVQLDAPASPLSSYTVRGWLRDPDYDFRICDASLPCPEGYTCEFDRCEPLDCPDPEASTGSIVTPTPGSSQGSAFTVSGSVSDGNGIVKVTAAIDTLSNCKFSVTPSDPTVSTFDFQIPVDPASCALQTGDHVIGIWVEDGCGLSSQVATVDFSYTASDCSPGTTCCDAQGQYVPSGQTGPSCSGDCRQCDGAGGCTPLAAGTPCGSGGTCDGQGSCDAAYCGDGNIDSGEQCDDTNLGSSTCETLGFDDGTLSCTSSCTYDTTACFNESIEPSPAQNTWTPGFTVQSSCTCSASNTDCHTLYQARVTSISGNTAQMEFRKVNPPGGGPSTTVSYWVVVGDTHPSCLDLHAYVTRTSGSWSQGQVTLPVSVNIWPSQADYDAAPCGETKALFIITGGGGGFETTRLWFQEQAVVFTKSCN
jgi:surface antigen